MSGRDRRKYLTASALDQALLDWCHDNLETRIEMICDIEAPDGSTIRVSDRNKYVGSHFYEARVQFPTIKRTLGEWLDSKLEFSTLNIEVSNVDGKFNQYLPGGDNYGGFINRAITVKIGLAEQESTYTSIFSGKITDIGGMKRSTKSITFLARDNFYVLDSKFPSAAFTRTAYPDLEDRQVGKMIPVIYGDYTVSLDPDPAVIPAYPVNGANRFVNGGQEYSGSSAASTPVTDEERQAVQCIISYNDLAYLDTGNVWMKRGDTWSLVPSSEIIDIGSGNKSFKVKQNGPTWVVKDDATTEKFLFSTSDLFYVRCRGKDLGTHSDNIVSQAKDILVTFGGLDENTAFDSTWTTYRNKSYPAKSAVKNIKARAWIEKQQSVIEYALSMLEQVRLEAFINRSQKMSLHAMHFEEFTATTSNKISNWDVVQGTFKPSLSEINNFNRAQAFYDYRPNREELGFTTPVHKNQASINQLGGKAISKEVDFPNLYVEADVKYQLIEILRMSSSLHEDVEVTLTWRSMLRELGDFAKMTVDIGGTVMTDVPVMLRQISYNPAGITIPIKGWLLALLPFPGYNPEYAGTVGGYQATITEE